MTEEIQKLSPYKHVRLRTTVYYGATTLHTGYVPTYKDNVISIKEESWIPAVFTCFREIVDNSLDEIAVHGFGNKIDIEYDPKTMTFVVEDNGRGIPIDWDESHKMHKATLALGEIMSGRNFDERAETAGMNGIGASGVNFCSESFNLEIHRDGKKFLQEFREGDELQISEPKITNKKGKTGTKISFKLSKKVFKDLTLPEEFVKDRIFELACANPNIKFSYNGTPIKVQKTITKSLFSNYENVKLDIISKDNSFTSNFWLIPNVVEKGDYAYSLVNNIPTLSGGNHIDSLKKYFVNGLLTALERESKKRKLTPNRTDVLETMFIFNVTKLKNAEFDSQSKTRLINEEVDRYIKEYFDSEDVFKSIIRQHKSWIDSIYERCAARTQKKDNAELAKANRKLMRMKVPKLLDANGRDRTKCILAIAEGDSAVSSIASVRDPEIHGAIPLRGKILNVRGENSKVIIENQILADLMSSIGIGLGQEAVRSDLRYGKIYLAADQDPDGFNIMALLVNFFYLHWPELFDPKQEPFFYAFQTPFIIQEKGKKRYYWYADDYQNYNPNDWKGCPKPTRAKGLGSLEEIDWTNSLLNPKLIPLVDDGNLSDALSLIFDGKKADLRKEWISL